MQVVAALIVVVTLVLMTTGKVPAVLALVCALVAAGLLGIATPEELFAGLGNGSVITIAAMLVIAKGVIATGVVSRVTYRLLSGVKTATGALIRLMPPVGVVSSMLSTTPIVAMLVPATKELQQRSGVAAHSVLLPVAHAATLVGSATLIGASTNLLIEGLARGDDVQLGMFSFAPIALPVAVVGWIVLVIAARLMLRAAPQREKAELSWRVEIPVSTGANAVGRVAAGLGIDKTSEFRLIGIQRWGRSVATTDMIEAGDVLVYLATEPGIEMLWRSPRFGLSPQHLYAVTVGSHESGTIRDLSQDEDIQVVAAETNRPLRHTRAVPGETVFVTAPSDTVLRGHAHVGLWQDVAGKAPQPAKTWVAIGILAAVILVVSFDLAPVELAATAGAVLMIVARVITPKSAVRALDWNILCIIAGSIGLGVIVVQSGLGGTISDAVLALSGGVTPLIVIVLAVGTTLLTNVVTNAAAAAILTPVALKIAEAADLDPVLLLTLIGTCISFTFLNPYSHQTNLMVMRPGQYTMGQFFRFGIPVTLVCVAAAATVAWALLELVG